MLAAPRACLCGWGCQFEMGMGMGKGGVEGRLPERRPATDFVVECEGAGGACAAGVSDTPAGCRDGAAYSVLSSSSHSG